MTFSTKAERDAWVNDDPMYNSNITRSAENSKFVRKYFRKVEAE